MSNLFLTCLIFTTLSLYGAGYAEASLERHLEHWDFTSAPDTLGWTALHSVDPLSVKEGALQMRINASDPYIGSPGIEINTNDLQYIRVTMRSEVRGNGQIFWAAGPSFREARFKGADSARFSIKADGRFHIYYVLPFWKPGSKVYRIRIDAPEGLGKLLEIKDVAILQRNTVADPPSEPDYDFSAPGAIEFWMPYQDMEDMSLEDDALKVHVSGEMPAVVGPPFKISAGKARLLNLQMKVTDCARAEVWYSTGSGFPPPNRHSFPTIPDGEFHIYNIDLSEARGYEGTIARMAIALVDAGLETHWFVRSVGLNSTPSGLFDK